MPADGQSKQAALDDARPIPPRYRWLKRIGLAAILLLIATFALRWVVGVVAQRRLDAHVAKLRAAGEPMLPEDFAFPAVPDQDNAAILLKKAAELLVEPGKDDLSLAGYLRDPELVNSNEETVGALLRANEEPLRLLRDARFKPAVDWGNRFSSPMLTIDTIRPMDHIRVERLAQVGCLAALNAWGHDEHAEAFERVLDVLDLGNRLNEGHPFVLTSLIGTMASGYASDVLEWIASTPLGSPALARQAIAVLLDESTLAAGFTEAYRVERAGLLDAVPGMPGSDELLEDHFWRSAWTTAGRLEWWFSEPLLKLDGVRIVNRYTVYVHASRVEDVPSLKSALPTPAFSFETLLAKRARLLRAPLLPQMHSTLRCTIVDRARRRLTATKLALRLYLDDHGHLPAALHELVPDYIPFVPADPTSAGDEPILYVCAGPEPHVGFRSDLKGGQLRVLLFGRLGDDQGHPSRPQSEQGDDDRDHVKDEPGQADENENPADKP
jgi:hypothetical protein